MNQDTYLRQTEGNLAYPRPIRKALDEYTKKAWSYAWNGMLFTILYQVPCADETSILIKCKLNEKYMNCQYISKNLMGLLYIKCGFNKRMQICFALNTLITMLSTYNHIFSMLNILSHYPRSLIWQPHVRWPCRSANIENGNCIIFIHYILNIYTYKQTKFQKFALIRT